MPQAPLLSDCELDNTLREIIASSAMPAVAHGTVDRGATDALCKWLKVSKHDAVSPSCQAGLWLLVGDLNASHTLSQDITTPDGSFWHGIMHRREGDYENAKYWFRRVGSHPVLEELSQEISALQARDAHASLLWSELRDARRVAPALVDACRHGETETLQLITWIEWQLLFRHCYQAAK